MKLQAGISMEETGLLLIQSIPLCFSSFSIGHLKIRFWLSFSAAEGLLKDKYNRQPLRAPGALRLEISY